MVNALHNTGQGVIVLNSGVPDSGFVLAEPGTISAVHQKNLLHLDRHGWREPLEATPDTLECAANDPLLSRTLNVVRGEVKRTLVFQKIMSEPMFLNPRDLPEVTDEDIDTFIANHIRSFSLLIHSVWLFAQGEIADAVDKHCSALEQAEQEWNAFVAFYEDRMTRTMAAIKALDDGKLKEMSEPAYQEFIDMSSARFADDPLKRASILGLLKTGSISDDLCSLAKHYMKVDKTGRRSRFLWELGLAFSEASPPLAHSADDFSHNLAYLDLRQRGARGMQLLRRLVGVPHVFFSRFAAEQAAQDTPFGEGLRTHFQNVKDATVSATKHVDQPGNAVVLGAGKLVITPTAEMLNEQVTDGVPKFPRIKLIELGDGLTEKAVGEMVGSDEIDSQQASRLDILRGDATLILTKLTSEIDRIMEEALRRGTGFPRNQIAEIYRDLSENPFGMGRFAPSASERTFADESISFAVLTVASQDFVSPIKDYIDVWARCFSLEDEDKKVLDQWDGLTKNIENRLDGLILADMWRSLSRGGVMFFTEPTGMRRKVCSDEGEQMQKADFFDEQGLISVVPTGLYDVAERRTWHRPINDPRVKEGEAYFIIESLALKKK
jgi:hypothetical protein